MCTPKNSLPLWEGLNERQVREREQARWGDKVGLGQSGLHHMTTESDSLDGRGGDRNSWLPTAQLAGL